MSNLHTVLQDVENRVRAREGIVRNSGGAPSLRSEEEEKEKEKSTGNKVERATSPSGGEMGEPRGTERGKQHEERERRQNNGHQDLYNDTRGSRYRESGTRDARIEEREARPFLRDKEREAAPREFSRYEDETRNNNRGLRYREEDRDFRYVEEHREEIFRDYDRDRLPTDNPRDSRFRDYNDYQDRYREEDYNRSRCNQDDRGFRQRNGQRANMARPQCRDYDDRSNRYREDERPYLSRDQEERSNWPRGTVSRDYERRNSRPSDDDYNLYQERSRGYNDRSDRYREDVRNYRSRDEGRNRKEKAEANPRPKDNYREPSRGAPPPSREGYRRGYDRRPKEVYIDPSQSRESQIEEEEDSSFSRTSSFNPEEHSKKMEAYRKEREELEMKIKLMSIPSSRSTTIRGYEAELRKIEAEMANLSSTKEMQQASANRKFFGIDICIMMDCTGSMSSWINKAKEQARQVMEAASKIDLKAVSRIAFIAYRDHCDGADRLKVVDFVEEQQIDTLKQQLNNTPATGGGDTPEDIAGALQAATQLSWFASTRLIIHIGDAPCHGKAYHDCDDSYPAGDPNNLVPEELLRKLCNKSIDYYFFRINHITDKMVKIFEAVYQNSGSTFQQWNIGQRPEEYLPNVIKSIRSSMSRSVAFRGGMGLY